MKNKICLVNESTAFSFRKGNILFIMLLILHNNWCHVIDTTLKLYTIVGLGIKLVWSQWMFVRSWRWTLLCLPWEHCFVCLEILALQQQCSSKGQIWTLFLCKSWQMHFFSKLLPQRFQAIWNIIPHCSVIIGHATDKVFNQCIKS